MGLRYITPLPSGVEGVRDLYVAMSGDDYSDAALLMNVSKETM